ncbi:MAG: hypothetical protein JW910_15070 [Anaerolineae bacterium]|nr:hypothetical protein [Anaerolineae bacterium]
MTARLKLALLGLACVGLALLLAVPLLIAAQGADPVPTATVTPTPDPTATAAAALFTVSQAELVSHYPDGVEYIVRASSSAGTIARVQVTWWLTASVRESHTLDWDEEREAFVWFDRMFQPPWFEVSYLFRLTDSAGNRYTTAELADEYVDPNPERDWIRRENDQVIILMLGARPALADDLFAIAARNIEVLTDRFGYGLDFRPYIVVVPDQATFDEWREYVDINYLGFAFWDRGYTIQRLDQGEDVLAFNVVSHELTHIFQNARPGPSDLPRWFIEGHASYMEDRHYYDYEARVLPVAHQIPSLEADISLDFPGPDGGGRWAYDVGFCFIKYWILHYGWDSHRAFWEAQQSMDFYEAMEAATGLPFTELELQFRAYMGAGPAPTFVPTPTMRPFPTAPSMPTLPGSS